MAGAAGQWPRGRAGTPCGPRADPSNDRQGDGRIHARKAQRPAAKTFRALDNVSFSIAKGEKVGIIGLNGAGKTTLLRTIAGIFTPSHGKSTVNGAVCPLLDFHSGFDENLTGIENITIRLMFLGLSRRLCARSIYKEDSHKDRAEQFV